MRLTSHSGGRTEIEPVWKQGAVGPKAEEVAGSVTLQNEELHKLPSSPNTYYYY
jgi:hypothetical protein